MAAFNSPFVSRLRRGRLRPLLLAGVVIITFAQVVMLTPSSLEQADSGAAQLDPEDIISEEQEGVTLAPGIPKDRIAEYTVDGFNFVSVNGGQKQWKLVANRAFLFDKEKLVHSRSIHATLFETEGKVTIVTGKESRYFMNQRDLEVYGDVKAVLSDGFVIRSEYLHYRPGLGRIDIPPSYAVSGESSDTDTSSEQRLSFHSQGMEFQMKLGKFILPANSQVTMTPKPKTPNEQPDTTTIESDRCEINRTTQVAHFTMERKRPAATRFVRIIQPTMFTRARRADLNYGSFSKVLNYMVAYEDVLIKETGNKASLRYGTGGRADFDAVKNIIILRNFPQVYQDNDTVTGDIIVMHRDTDVVEVEQSNAFSQGNQ